MGTVVFDIWHHVVLHSAAVAREHCHGWWRFFD